MKTAGQKYVDGSKLISVYDLLPVGTVIQSMLTEVQLNSETNGGWVLANGQSVSGSRYETVTGNSNIPDLRGQFLRGKNNGRSDGNQDPDGERSIGDFKDGKTALPNNSFGGNTNQAGNHNHTTSIKKTTSTSGNILSANIGFGDGVNATINDWTNSNGDHTHSIAINSGGDNETSPKNVAVNYFIKID